MPCTAIIVASGTSQRMGFDKLAAPLKGVPVLRRTVDAFMASEKVERVIVVCPQDRFDELLVPPFPKPLKRVDGGKERQFSVAAGLAALSEEDLVVAVHDGARPLVSPQAIDESVDLARKYGAASLARPITETIKKADPEGFTRTGVDRKMLWFMETPQVFRTSVLRRAYERVQEDGVMVTDEVSAVETMGIGTKLIQSQGPNLKITHPSDIALAEALLGE